MYNMGILKVDLRYGDPAENNQLSIRDTIFKRFFSLYCGEN